MPRAISAPPGLQIERVRVPRGAPTSRCEALATPQMRRPQPPAERPAHRFNSI